MKLVICLILFIVSNNTGVLAQFNPQHPKPKSFKYYNTPNPIPNMSVLKIAQLYGQIDSGNNVANFYVFYSDGMVKVVSSSLGEDYSFLTSQKYFVDRSKTMVFGYYKIVKDTIYWTTKVFYDKKEREYKGFLSDSGKVLQIINPKHRNSLYTLNENGKEYLPRMYANRNYNYSYLDTINGIEINKIGYISFNSTNSDLHFEFEQDLQPSVKINYETLNDRVIPEPKIRIESYQTSLEKSNQISIKYSFKEPLTKKRRRFEMIGTCTNNCNSIIFIENEYTNKNKLVKTRNFVATFIENR